MDHLILSVVGYWLPCALGIAREGLLARYQGEGEGVQIMWGPSERCVNA